MPFKFKLSRRLARLKWSWFLVVSLPTGCVSSDKLGVGPEPPSLDMEVARVVISPDAVTLRVGETAEFDAFALTASGDTAPTLLRWRVAKGTISDNAGDKPGKRKGHYKSPSTSGTDTVIVTDTTGHADTATVTVTVVAVASVSVSPSSAALLVGESVQLSASVTDSAGNELGGRQVTWTSNAPAIATVNSNGRVSGVGPGSATIQASSEGQSGTASVTVTSVPVASVEVSPSAANVSVGGTVQLSAIVKDGAGNTLSNRSVTWSTSNAGVASVSSSGRVTGVATGTATVTATSEGKSGTATVTVSNAAVASVTVSPSTANINVGGTVQLSAVLQDGAGNTLTGRTVSWATSAASIAAVSSAGLVTGVAGGNATITASSEGQSGSATVTVTIPPPPGGTCAWTWPAAIPAPLPASRGDTFYVATSGSDGAAGSASAPWRTIQHAFNTLRAGEVAIVRPGNYGGRGVTMSWSRAGSPSAPITVTGMPGQPKPHIIADISMSGSYIRLSHVIVEGNGEWGTSTQNGGNPIDMAGGDHLELSFSEIFHSMMSGVLEYGDNIFILNNYIHDNGAFEDPSAENLRHGIYLHPTSNVVIANNIVEHNRAKGIMGRHDGHHVWILHNTIVGSGRQGISIYESTHDWTVANNIVAFNGNVNGGTGISADGSSGGLTHVFSHNIAWHNGRSGNDNWSQNQTLINNLAVDPLLVNPANSVPTSNHQAWSNDYHLRTGSPAVGHFDSRFVMPIDFEGQCRSASAPAAGAYEP